MIRHAFLHPRLLPRTVRTLPELGMLLLLSVTTFGCSRLPAASAPPVSIAPPEAARVTALAAVIDARAVLPRYDDAALWRRIAGQAWAAQCLSEAEAAAVLAPIAPADFDRAYRRYAKDGNRTDFQNLVAPANHSLAKLALGECIDRRGRFLPALTARLWEICAWPTWMINAHDHQLKNLTGKVVEIDLWVAARGADLAAVLLMLEPQLPPELATRIRAEIRRRVLVPYWRQIHGQAPAQSWQSATHNWGAVCLYGVAASALGIARDAAEAAWFVASCERQIGNYLGGFASDGTCVEGLTYWNYGYGNFIMLSEWLRRASGGQVDPFRQPVAQRAGVFPIGLHIVDGVYPTMADCSFGVVPEAAWTGYVARRLGLPGAVVLDGSRGYGLAGRALFVQPERIPAGATEGAALTDPLRHSFPAAGVWVLRSPQPAAWGLAIKGGHNGEHHNHNDLGAWSLVAGGRAVLCDPGRERYHRDTFNPRTRYRSPAMNSYGHPVPLVAGQQQQAGAQFQARLLSQTSTPVADLLELDLAGAYAVPGLRALTRRVSFDRMARTATITDTVRFATPQRFATALVTYGTVRREGDALIVQDGAATVTVRVMAPRWTLRDEVLDADWDSLRQPGERARRIGIDLDETVTEAAIAVAVTVP